eukprot:gene17833-18058_t
MKLPLPGVIGGGLCALLGASATSEVPATDLSSAGFVAVAEALGGGSSAPRRPQPASASATHKTIINWRPI